MDPPIEKNAFMFTPNGIGVDSWVRVDDRGRLKYELTGDQAQLRFGSERGNGLTLVLTEQALEELETTAGEALRILRGQHATDDPAPPSTDDQETGPR